MKEFCGDRLKSKDCIPCNEVDMENSCECNLGFVKNGNAFDFREYCNLGQVFYQVEDITLEGDVQYKFFEIIHIIDKANGDVTVKCSYSTSSHTYYCTKELYGDKDDISRMFYPTKIGAIQAYIDYYSTHYKSNIMLKGYAAYCKKNGIKYNTRLLYQSISSLIDEQQLNKREIKKFQDIVNDYKNIQGKLNYQLLQYYNDIGYTIGGIEKLLHKQKNDSNLLFNNLVNIIGEANGRNLEHDSLKDICEKYSLFPHQFDVEIVNSLGQYEWVLYYNNTRIIYPIIATEKKLHLRNCIITYFHLCSVYNTADLSIFI